MAIYLISSDKGFEYDTYDSAVVVADNEEKARLIHPDAHSTWGHHGELKEMAWAEPGSRYYRGEDDWTDPKNVTVELVGTAKPGTKAGVICASFNAG